MVARRGGGTCTSTTTQLTVRRSTGRWNSQSVRMRRSSASCTARVPGSPCNPPPPPRQSREGSCLPSQVACSYRQSPSQLSHCRSVVARRFYAMPPRTRCDQVSLLARSGDASRIFTRPPSVLGSVFSSAGADNVYYIMGRCLWRHPVCMGGGESIFLCLGRAHQRRYRRMEVPWRQSHRQSHGDVHVHTVPGAWSDGSPANQNRLRTSRPSFPYPHKSRGGTREESANLASSTLETRERTLSYFGFQYCWGSRGLSLFSCQYPGGSRGLNGFSFYLSTLRTQDFKLARTHESMTEPL